MKLHHSSVVCMYVLLYFSGIGMYHRCHFMKNILQYHKLYATNKCEFLLLRESPSFGILTYIRIAFESGLFWGERTLRFFDYLFAEERHTRSLILCPAHRNLFFGVNWWGIVSCLPYGCALFSEKSN